MRKKLTTLLTTMSLAASLSAEKIGDLPLANYNDLAMPSVEMVNDMEPTQDALKLALKAYETDDIKLFGGKELFVNHLEMNGFFDAFNNLSAEYLTEENYNNLVAEIVWGPKENNYGFGTVNIKDKTSNIVVSSEEFDLIVDEYYTKPDSQLIATTNDSVEVVKELAEVVLDSTLSNTAKEVPDTTLNNVIVSEVISNSVKTIELSEQVVIELKYDSLNIDLSNLLSRANSYAKITEELDSTLDKSALDKSLQQYMFLGVDSLDWINFEINPEATSTRLVNLMKSVGVENDSVAMSDITEWHLKHNFSEELDSLVDKSLTQYISMNWSEDGTIADILWKGPNFENAYSKNTGHIKVLDTDKSYRIGRIKYEDDFKIKHAFYSDSTTAVNIIDYFKAVSGEQIFNDEVLPLVRNLEEKINNYNETVFDGLSEEEISSFQPFSLDENSKAYKFLAETDNEILLSFEEKIAEYNQAIANVINDGSDVAVIEKQVLEKNEFSKEWKFSSKPKTGLRTYLVGYDNESFTQKVILPGIDAEATINFDGAGLSADYARLLGERVLLQTHGSFISGKENTTSENFGKENWNKTKIDVGANVIAQYESLVGGAGFSIETTEFANGTFAGRPINFDDSRKYLVFELGYGNLGTNITGYVTSKGFNSITDLSSHVQVSETGFKANARTDNLETQLLVGFRNYNYSNRNMEGVGQGYVVKGLLEGHVGSFLVGLFSELSNGSYTNTLIDGLTPVDQTKNEFNEVKAGITLNF